MHFTAIAALVLLGSMIGAILVIAAHALFRITAPRVYGLTFGATGLGAGAVLFYSGVRHGENGGWAVLGGFALGGVYLLVAIASFAGRGDRTPPPWTAVLGVSGGGIAGGVGGAYLLDWLPLGGLGWNVVGVILGTALGATVGAVVTTPDPGPEARARDWAITVAGTLFLAYFAAITIGGLADREKQLLPPKAVDEFVHELFHNSSDPRPGPPPPGGAPDIHVDNYAGVDCERGRPDQACGKITITSIGGEDLILKGVAIEPVSPAAELQPWNVFAPDDSRNTCLLGKRYPPGGKPCDLVVRFVRNNPPGAIIIHENKGSGNGKRVPIPAPGPPKTG
jgi:hypothetical protein